MGGKYGSARKVFNYDAAYHKYVPDWIGVLINFWFFYFILLAIMIVMFIQFVDKCNLSCCCNCCSRNCFPVKKLTYLDVNNLDDNNTTEEDIEMGKLE